MVLILISLPLKTYSSCVIQIAPESLALLVTPFVLDYDLLLLAFPLAVLADNPRPWEKAGALAGFVLPALARPLAMNSGIAIAPLVLIVLFALLLRRAHAPITTRAPV